ncbi:MAG: PASTA domain-containing protein [Nitrospinae bacterium]|nr:PASTA domain-containing protein [Nitrospinota bacterium]
MLKGILKGVFWIALLVALGGAGGAAGLYLFRGGEGVFLPRVAGLDVIRALELLGEKGIPMQVTGRVFSDAVSMNHVVRQNPPGGRRIRKGRTVSLVLSKGPRDVAVPAVVGKNLNRAESLIRQEGLRVRLVERLYDPERPIDQILGVWPGEGESIRRGEGVVLVVSQGPRERAYVMPSLIGEPVNNALDKVRTLGLAVGRVRYVDRPGSLRGSIVSQIPPRGRRVLAGHRVHVDVARGADQMAGNFIVLRYRVPHGKPRRALRVELESNGQTREELSREVSAGEEIHLLVRVKGEARARIFLDGRLVEEQTH